MSKQLEIGILEGDDIGHEVVPAAVEIAKQAIQANCERASSCGLFAHLHLTSVKFTVILDVICGLDFTRDKPRQSVHLVECMKRYYLVRVGHLLLPDVMPTTESGASPPAPRSN